jgi:acetyl esterase/lipase
MPVATRRRGLLAALAALPLAACSPVALLNATIPRESFRKSADLAYGAQARQRLDVYAPAQGAGPHPVVVFFYGGAWVRGARQDYLFVGEALAASGWVGVVADYRLYPDVRFPAFVEDAAAAVAWTCSRIGDWGGDPQRVFVMGHSAGAYLALMLALDARYLAARDLQPARLAGAIGLAGPYDFLPLRGERMKAIFGPDEDLARTQPITHANGSAPPLLLLHGERDTTVSVRNTRNLAERVRSRGGRVETILYPDQDHRGIVAALAAPFRGREPVLGDVARFVAAAGAPLPARA